MFRNENKHIKKLAYCKAYAKKGFEIGCTPASLTNGMILAIENYLNKHEESITSNPFTEISVGVACLGAIAVRAAGVSLALGTAPLLTVVGFFAGTAKDAKNGFTSIISKADKHKKHFSM